jgi:hypothetical protein
MVLKKAKSNDHIIRDEDGLSPYPRPVMQGFLEQAVSSTIKQLAISSEQRDQHRILRSLIRMACRVSIYMNEDSMQQFLALVTELYIKSKAEIDGSKKLLPPRVKPKFHNSVLSIDALQKLLKG